MLNVTAEEALEHRNETQLLLLTATETETMAVQAALRPLPTIGDIAKTHVENHTYRLGKFGEFGAVHVQCVMGTRDAGSAMSTTKEAVRCWTPRAVVMMGIAWGNPSKIDFPGDVLVSTAVQDFEHTRVGMSEEFRSSPQSAGVKLLDRFRNVTVWPNDLPDGRKSSQHLGLLLSGDKLIRNAEFRDKLLNEFKRAIGGDMESWGVAQACRELNVEWIVVKGVCDFGDEHKDDTWQLAAANASVSLCLAVLSHPSALDGLVCGLGVDSAAILKDVTSYEPPNEIPAFTDRLVGRQSELKLNELMEGFTSVKDRMALCSVVGMGGVGKTFLCAETARRLLAAGVFPDGVIWHEIGEQSPHQVMAHVCHALDVDVTSGEESAVAAKYRRALQDRRVLIVVDNALVPGQITPLLIENPGSALLVTSRNHMPSLRSRMAEQIDLKPMTPDNAPGDAVDLLIYKSGIQNLEERTALDKIAFLCGYLQLALSIAGALLAEREMWPSVESFEKRLQKHRLDCLAIEGCPNLDVRAVLLLSYEKMDADLARVFRSLSVLGRSTFGASAVSYMLGRNKDTTIRDLAKLIGRSVLERSSYGRYVMHDLLRELAQELVTRDEPIEEAVELGRRADGYWAIWHEALASGVRASQYAKKGDYAKAIEFYEKAQTLNNEIGDRHGQASALGGIAAVYAKKGDYAKAIESYEKAQTLNNEIGDRHGQASALGGLAAAYAQKGQLDKAVEYHEQSLALSKEIGDQAGQASALGGLAAVYAQKGQLDKAVEYHEQSLALSKKIGDQARQASALGGLAAEYAQKGQPDKAVEYHEQSLALSKEIGDQAGQASALGGLAAVYAQKGDYAKAIEFYEKAQALNNETGDQAGQASALGGLAAVYAQKGQLDRAVEYHEQSLALSKKIGDQAGQASALGGLAAAYAQKGDYAKAIEFYERAQALNNETGDQAGQASALGGLAAVYADLGSWEKAKTSYEKALGLNRTIGDLQAQAKALGGLASVYSQKKEWLKVIQYQEEALDVSLNLNDPRGQEKAIGGIALAHLKLGNFDKSIEYQLRALEINKKSNYLRGQAKAYGALAEVYQKKGEPDKAIEYYQHAQAINKVTGDLKGQARALGGIASIYFRQKKWDQAIDYLEEVLVLNRRMRDRFILRTLYQLAVSYRFIGDFKKACEYIQEAYEISQGKDGAINQLFEELFQNRGQS